MHPFGCTNNTSIWMHCSLEISMEYAELIKKALAGRSARRAAQMWDIPPSTLDRYMRGDRMPDYNTGLRIAKEAGVDPAEAFEVFAAEERNKKAKNFKLQMGFASIGQLGVIAAICTAVILFLTPIGANASPVPHNSAKASAGYDLYYVKYDAFVKSRSAGARCVPAIFQIDDSPLACQPPPRTIEIAAALLSRAHL